MRKVTKILAKLLSAMIMLLIILPLALSLALSLPRVQQFALQRFVDLASAKVGSNVSVGSIRFSMLQSFELQDLLIEDHGADTLFYSKDVSVRIDNFSLLGKSLFVEKIALRDAELRLREMPDSVLNIKKIVDKITNPNGDKTFKTIIGSVEAENFDVSLSRLEHKCPEYGVDLGNIAFDGVSAKVSNFTSQGGVTELTINSFVGREQSGFDVKSFSAQLVVYVGVVDFVDLKASTATSKINMPRVRLESDTWEEYKAFNSSVSLELSSEGSRLSSSDLAYFAPALKGKQVELRSLSASVNGTVDNLDVRLDRATFGERSSVSGTASVIGVVDFPTASFEVGVDKLYTNSKDVNEVVEGFSGSPLSAEVRGLLTKLGGVEVKSTVMGSLNDMDVVASMLSPLGRASYRGAVRGATEQLDVQGAVTTSAFNVGTLVGNKSLGAVSMGAAVNYRELSEEALDATLKASIESLAYNSCTYSGIAVDATFDGEIVEGAISSKDEKFNFDLGGLVNLGENKHYDLTLRVSRADLHAMQINLRDTISSISGSVRVNLGGNTLDDLSGSVTLRNVNYDYNDESIYAPSISLTARNSDENKYIDMRSDFVDMTFNSKSSFEAIYNYLSQGLRSYIPMLYTEHTERKESRRVTLVNNYSTLTVDFKNTTQITNAILSDFDIADNSSVNLMVNPYSERFSVRLESDYVQFNSFAATDLSINTSNDNDSLSLYATAADIFLGRSSFSSYTLMAGARNNVVELSTGFRDLPSETSATLGMRVRFDDERKANISLRPSNVTLGDDVWIINARNIVGSSESLDVNDFEMVNGSQKLSINGVVSKNPSDSLILKLDNYDISMITSVINDLGYNVEGLSNGYVNMSELLDSPRILADVRLDSVEVNSIPSPALRLSAGWSTNQNRAVVFVTNRQSRDTVVTGYYAPTDRRYFAHLKVDSLNMGLLDPLLKTTIEGTKGYANVDVSLSGRGREASLHGGIDAYDLTTKVIFTQVDYSLPKAYISVDDNKFTAQAQRVYDEKGNSGLATLNLSLDHLSNVSYRLRIAPENMMVLNTTEQDNELFYGTIFATGVATIEGDKRGVNMDITATSNANSNFYMPLTTQMSVAKTDFITFVQSKEEEEQSSSANFRRNFVDERKRRTGQAASSLNINMALHATPDLDFQLVIDPVVGDIIKAKGEGRLNLNISPQDNLFEMYGDYNITEGNYLFTLLNPISKRFVIDSGSSIQWTGDPFDPILDIDAVYKVKTSLDPLINSTSEYSSATSSRAVPVDCIIELGDRLSQPSVNFSIDVPTADTEQQAVIANTLIDQETISQQFFYLMFANSFIPVSTSYGSGLTSSTTASTGFELLTNQLSNWLSSSNYNVVIRYRPESDLTSDEVDVGFSRGLIDNRLLIEVEGNYLADNKAATGNSDLSNFMGEAYITWLIDKAGAFRLKGFTQTIDRYDENQGLQETGIGVYYSESFENFKDLKRRIKERFTRKKEDE